MKIIVLDGKSNSGKTTTLTDVFKTIAPKGTQTRYVIPNKDFETDFLYKNKKIALCTGGDTITYINECIEIYNKQKVDILIIAHNNGKQYSPKKLFLADEIQIIHKTANNNNDALSIISKI